MSRERFEFDAAEVVLDHLSELKAILQDRSLKRPAKIQAVRRRLFGVQPGPAEAGSFQDQEPKLQGSFKDEDPRGQDRFVEDVLGDTGERSGLAEEDFSDPLLS